MKFLDNKYTYSTDWLWIYFDTLELDKFAVFYRTIKEHGGVISSVYKLFLMDNFRPGKLVGTDQYGNKYFENPNFIYGRDRWVEYAPHYYLEYDASLVPAEWFGWLHHKTDITPDKDFSRPKYKWMAEHKENSTGTPGQYMSYSTVRSKIHPWIPPKKSS